jgi:hypothetical protein
VWKRFWEVWENLSIFKINNDMKKQYVYIGQYYHIKNKDLPQDFKFGVTENLTNREYSLGRTKSPIKYVILRAWELPSNVKRETVEKLIELFFFENKYEGCEWYDIDGDTFQEKISLLFSTLSDMISDESFSFIEVDLNLSEETNSEDLIDKEIRKRNESKNLKIILNGVDISQPKAVDGYREFVKNIFTSSGTKLLVDFPEIISNTQIPYTTPLEGTNLFLKTGVDTKTKNRYINDIIKKYGLNCTVDSI